MLRYLVNELKADAEISICSGKSESNLTLLQHALCAGDVELTKVLIELGAKTPWEGESRDDDTARATAADVLVEVAGAGYKVAACSLFFLVVMQCGRSTLT